MRVRRNIEETLNLADDPYDTKDECDEQPAGESLAEDLKFVKKQLRKSMTINHDIVDIVLEELKAEPTPRMAEVAARLLETLSNSGIQILQASKTVAEICKLAKEEQPKKDQQPLTEIKNAIFVGSLNDVFKLQEAQKKVLESGDPYATS